MGGEGWCGAARARIGCSTAARSELSAISILLFEVAGRRTTPALRGRPKAYSTGKSSQGSKAQIKVCITAAADATGHKKPWPTLRKTALPVTGASSRRRSIFTREPENLAGQQKAQAEACVTNCACVSLSTVFSRQSLFLCGARQAGSFAARRTTETDGPSYGSLPRAKAGCVR